MPKSEPDRPSSLIALVGPCSSGKSTLKSALLAEGFNVRHLAQEHSYVPYKWKRITNPDILIYLDVDYPTTLLRRPHSSGGPQRLADQHQKLAHAREHCHFYLDTSNYTSDQVKSKVLAFLDQAVACLGKSIS